MVFFHHKKSQSSPEVKGKKNDRFATDMLSALKEFYPDTPFVYDPRSDMIEAADGYEGPHDYKFFLGNLRNRILEMGREARQQYIRETIITFTDDSEVTSEELKSNLYLRARTGSELSLRNIILEAPKEKPSTVAAIMRGDVILETVMDVPNGVRMVDLETLAENDLDLDGAINLAATNLLRTTPEKTDDLWEKMEANIWISKLNDDYDAARLFVFPEEMKLPFEEQALAYTPSHSIVLITNSGDEETLKKMVDLGNTAAETHRPLSFDLWQQAAEGWTKMTSKDRNSFVFQIQLESLARAYGEQKEVLEQVFEKTETDIFVASVMLVEDKETKQHSSLAVLIDGHSYIPVVDYVIPQFEDTAKQNISTKVKWDRFVDIMGPEKLEAVPGLMPKRLEFKGGMTEDLAAQLIAAGDPI